MKIHGREEGNVEQHGHQDEQGETEAGVETVGQVEAEDVFVVGIEQSCPLAQQLSSHTSGVGNDEECVPTQ